MRKWLSGLFRAAGVTRNPPDLGSALAIKVTRLLEPESVFKRRVPDVEALALHLTRIGSAIAAFDAAHPGELPSQVDAAVVMRAAGTRVWLMGPDGDLAAPGLDAKIASLPTLPVMDRHVAVILTLVRPGTTPEVSNDAVRVPSSWTAAAHPDGTDIDAVIDTVWPQ
jgi:hypothetical protein